MKVILDEDVALGAAAILRDAGHDTQHVLELGMGGRPDAAVLLIAAENGAIVATLDADFHQILATTGAKGPSVIRVRIEGLKGPQMAAMLLDVIIGARRELEEGAMVTVDRNRIRIRKLPVRST